MNGRTKWTVVIPFAVSIGLAWCFAATAAWIFLSSSSPVAQHPIRMELMAAVARDPRLNTELAAFVGAHFLIYGCLGLAGGLLGAASRRVWPGSRKPEWLVCASWTALLLAGAYVLNAALYPWSFFSSSHPLLTLELIGAATLADAIVLAIAAAALLVLARAALTFTVVRAQKKRIVAYALVLTMGAAAYNSLDLTEAADGVAYQAPHVVLIGIDSLRPDVVGKGVGVGVTPNIDAFLGNATLFDDAITPLARTFPAWTTVLTGRHPVASGARDNLFPPAVLHDSATLAERLRDAGYATFYATDEVRFSNIDETYGFDRVVSPKIGTSDFMLGSFTDSPLTNLVVNTRLGAALFPNAHANRAVSRTYRPEVFVDWVARELSIDGPTFMAVHLTLPHHPYLWADDNDEFFGRVSDHPYPYLAAVVAADKQFGALMGVLERRGVLNNAIVVLLSDHGEGLGLPSDNLLYDRAAKAALGRQLISMEGHGSSVLSPNQYRVMLAFRRYQMSAAAAAERRRVVQTPASLEDVAPTALALANVAFNPQDFDGSSLVQALSGGEVASELLQRVRFTETGLTTTVMRMGNFSEQDNLTEGLRFFEVDPSSSRVVFRSSRLPELLAQKERAALSSDYVLASVPEPATGRRRYILVKRAGGRPDVVTYEPDTIDHPEFKRLWHALRQRFGLELEDGSLADVVSE